MDNFEQHYNNIEDKTSSTVYVFYFINHTLTFHLDTAKSTKHKHSTNSSTLTTLHKTIQRDIPHTRTY